MGHISFWFMLIMVLIYWMKNKCRAALGFSARGHRQMFYCATGLRNRHLFRRHRDAVYCAVALGLLFAALNLLF
jgi:hypothetical protein